MASAAPSVGSVPAPSSSKRQSESPSAASRISTTFFMCPEKVESDCSMLCSSPMSANTSRNTARRLPWKAGMWSPACPIRVKRPTVFRETVLPPVFGPVMMRRLNSCPSHMLIGTTFSFGIRGWRPSLISTMRSVLKSGFEACIEEARRAFAKTKSSVASIFWFASSSAVNGASRALRDASIFAISCCSASVSSRYSLFKRTATRGSMKTVEPVELWSCTTPGSLVLNSLFTARQ